MRARPRAKMTAGMIHKGWVPSTREAKPSMRSLSRRTMTASTAPASAMNRIDTATIQP